MNVQHLLRKCIPLIIDSQLLTLVYCFWHMDLWNMCQLEPGIVM